MSKSGFGQYMVIPFDNFQSEKIKTALHKNIPILVKMHGDIEDLLILF